MAQFTLFSKAKYLLMYVVNVLLGLQILFLSILLWSPQKLNRYKILLVLNKKLKEKFCQLLEIEIRSMKYTNKVMDVSLNFYSYEVLQFLVLYSRNGRI